MKTVNQVTLFVIVALSLLCVFSITAQDDNNTVPTPVTIETAQVQLENEGIVVAVTGSLPSGCEFPITVTQRTVDNVLYVDIMEQTRIDVMCPMVLLSYSASIPLDVEIDNFPAQVIVNEVVAIISRTISIPASVQSIDPLPAHSYHEITDIAVAATINGDDDAPVTLEITVNGQQADLCEFEIFTETSYEDSVFIIEVYREIPPNVRCRAGIIEYENTFEFEVEAEEFDTFIAGTVFAIEANSYSVLVATSISEDEANLEVTFDVSLAQRNPITVETVTPDNFDEGAGLHVIGSYPSGCELPSRVIQTVERGVNVVRLEVYEIGYDESLVVPCPRILRQFDAEVLFEEPLSDGNYRYSVNDVVGDMVIGNNEVVSNVMNTIDTIIDTVEVAIAESSPPQLLLTITGYQSDGCEAIVNVDTEFDMQNNVITVHVYRNLPFGVMCPSVIVEYQETVNIGQVEAGTYTLIVNTYETEVEVQ